MKRLIPAVATALLFLGATASASPGHGSAGSAEFVGGRPGEPAAVDRTIRITATDLEYSRETVRVHAGETVRFIVTNEGAVMHDFTIGTPAVHRAHRKEMARMMANDGMAGHDDPNAIMLEPGETKSLIWTFEKTRNLEFACNVPGHYEAGMKGAVVFTGEQRSQ